MAIKIEIIGQALVITDTADSSIMLDAPKGEYYYKPKELSSNRIVLYNLDVTDNTRKNPRQIDLADAITSADVAFTQSTFAAFCRTNLGFKNGGSSGGGTVEGLVGGDDISIDDTNPAFPIINSTAGTDESLLPLETSDTGTEIFLTRSGGINSNFESANTNVVYTEGAGAVLNGWNEILINPATEPAVPVSWTPQGGIKWEAGLLHMVVRNTGAFGVVYYYLPTGVQVPSTSNSITAFKSADETITNDAVLDNDSDLIVSLEANSVYDFQITCIYNAGVTGRFKLGTVNPSGSSGYKYFDFDGVNQVVYGMTQSFNCAGFDPDAKMATIRGVIKTTTAGSFGVTWSQNVSSAEPTTLFENSHMVVTKLN